MALGTAGRLASGTSHRRSAWRHSGASVSSELSTCEQTKDAVH